MNIRYARIIGVLVLAAALGGRGLAAQAEEAGADASFLRGMSLNGSTGLYSIPSGRIGWERTRDIGFDLGYHVIINGGGAANIPKLGVSLLKWVELSFAFDVQPEGFLGNSRGADFIGGIKIQLPFKKSAIALGGNYQSLNFSSSESQRHKAGQVYVAVSFLGQLFNTPAETTVVIGKTFGSGAANWDIDFGMGFDMVLFPKTFGKYVHWVTDFSNFSYSTESFGAQAWGRGVLNTGIRIDLTVIPVFKKYRFAVDVLVTDIFDENRAFALGALFGIPIL